MPAGLSDKGKAHWKKVSADLKDAGILTNIDVHALAMYCESYARWADANEKIQQYGPVVKTPNGFPAQSPYIQIANKAFDQMRAMLTEFGMTPSSRTKISRADEDKEDDPWANL
ncbi:MAG: phage terminase small subunit P27 family [Pirellulaceae bacterium]